MSRILGDVFQILNGNVGLGTTQPRQLLDIQGGNAIINGSVGIGTTNPLVLLHVQDNAYFSGNVGIGSTQPISAVDTGRVRINNNNTYGQINLARNDGGMNLFIEGTGTGSTASIRIRNTGGTFTTAYELYDSHRWYVNTSTTERMRLDSSGNLGIGTTAPTHKLHIYSASRTDNDYETAGILLDNATQGEAAIAFRNSNIGVAGNVWVMGLNSNSTRFDIGYGTQSSQMADASVDMCINTDGNVGIGTTNPLQKLHIEGISYLNGTVTTNNNNINVGTGTVTANTFTGTATKVSQNLTRGTYLTGANYNGSVATTWAVDADTVATASKIVARDASANIFANGVGIGTANTTNANVSLSGEIYYNVSPLPVLTQTTTVDAYPIILHAQSTTGAGSLASNAIAFASMTSALTAQTPGAVIQFRRTGTAGFGALELCTKSDESLLSPVLPRIVMEGGNVGIGTTDVTAGKLVVAGNIVPTACNVYSLGTTNLRWKDIYLAGKTIDLDGAQITKDDVTGGILLQNANGGRGDIKAANVYTTGNVGIGTTIANLYTLDVEGDINFTGTLYKNGSIFSSGGGGANIASTEIQIAPIRKIFYVQDASQNTFTLIKSGFYGGHASNVQVFVGQNLLSYYNSNINDYYLSIGYNSSNTIYQVTLTENVDYASIVDITVWPSILPNSIFQGYANQYITTLWNSSGGVNVYYNAGTVGIGTVTPRQLLDVQGGNAIVSGNVGIGTVTPRQLLDVQGGNAIVSGNVGIGTTNALEKLHVQNGSIFINSGTIADHSTYYTNGGLIFYYNQSFRANINWQESSSSILLYGNTTTRLTHSANAYRFYGLSSEYRYDANGIQLKSGTFSSPADTTPPYLNLKSSQNNTWTIQGPYDNTTNSNLYFNFNNTQLLTLQKTGNIGIGTTDPTHKLHIYSASRTDNDYESTGILLDNATQGETAIAFRNSNVGVAGNVWVMGLNSNSTRFDIGYGDQTSQMADSSAYLSITSNGSVGIGTTNPQSKLDVRGDALIGSGTTASRLYLRDIANASWQLNTANFKLSFLNDNGGSYGTKMIIDNTGNVGIGTTTPVEKLDVAGNLSIGAGRAETYIRIRGSEDYPNGNFAASIIADRIYETATERTELLLAKGNDATSTWGPDRIRYVAPQHRFQVAKNGTGMTYDALVLNQNDAMLIDENGNVGIGTTVPRKLLDIQGGDAIVSGNVGIGTVTPRQLLDVQGGNAIVSGTIGIGTTNPTTKLQIMTPTSFDGDLIRYTSVGLPSAYYLNFNAYNPQSGFINYRYNIRNNNTDYNNVLVIETNKIGINTSRPLNSFDVRGDAIVSGNIGIGTTVPTHKLHIYSTSITDNDYESTGILLDNATQGETAIAFRNSNVGVAGNVWVMGLNSNSTRFDIGYGAQTSQLADSLVDMCIDTGGNVGIGTTNPLQKLHIEGTEYISTALGIGLTQPAYSLDVAGYVRSSLGFRVGANEVIDSDGNFILRSIQVLNGTGDTSLFVSETGSVGISTDNPVVPLDIRSTTVNISGNVGIGTTAPRQLLDVQGGNAIVSGNIGIGTTAPTHKLHIYSASRTDNDYESTGILLDNATQGEAAIAFRNSNVGVVGNVWVMGLNSNSTRFDIGYGAQTSQLADSSVNICIDTGGSVGIGTTVPNDNLSINVAGANTTRGISFIEDAAITGLNYGAAIRYNTGQDRLIIGSITNSTFKEAITINRDSANVGIGTTNPLELFHLRGKAYIDNTAVNPPANGVLGSSGTRIILWPGGASTIPYSIGIASSTLWYATPNSTIHAWYVGTTERMRLDANGNVGIGTATVRQKLDIQGGDAIVSGNVGIGTTAPLQKLDVYGNATIGRGQSGSSSSTVGGPFFKQNSWDTAGTTHTLTYPAFCIGDNSSGTLFIQVSNKSNKIGTAHYSFIKCLGFGVDIFESSYHRNTNLATFNVTTNGADIVVTTDSDCSISWTSIGSY